MFKHLIVGVHFLNTYLKVESWILWRKRFFFKSLQASVFNVLQSYILQGTNEGTNRTKNFQSLNGTNIIKRGILLNLFLMIVLC